MGRHLLLAVSLSIAAGCGGEPTFVPVAKEPSRKERAARTGTRVVILGSGTPHANPDRAGPSVAVAVDDAVYLVDAGPGVVRRAVAAGFAPEALKRVFITHLHSDHTLGLPDLLFTPWVLGREAPLEVWGPPGIAAMVEHVHAAWTADVRVRTEGLEEGSPTGHAAEVHEIEAGVVHDARGVRVTAFGVAHGSWDHAFGYRFDTEDRAIVISGDTAPTDAVVSACDGCDVLVHEAYARAGWETLPEPVQRYHASFHTSGVELGAIARAARPRLLVVVHALGFGAPEDALLAEIRLRFEGEVVIAEDLDEY